MALRVKFSYRYASQARAPSFHSFYMSSIKDYNNTSISMTACFNSKIRVVGIRYFLLWHNYEGMLYRLRITGQVLCGFVISPKGFIPLVLKESLTFFGSFGKPKIVNVEGFGLSGIRWVPKLPILLTPIRRSMPYHELGISRVGDQKLQAIDHQYVPYHEGRNFPFIDHYQ
jgi:hypothetical protein